MIYTKPIHCGGQCLYCFSQMGYPQSYIENEDTLRAKNCGWNPAQQINAIFCTYGLKKGHGAKCDITVLGGSFTEYPREYLRSYAKGIYDCLNGYRSYNLEEAIAHHEYAPDRCVIFSVESRPELITSEMCRFLVSLGVTMVELGVQSLNPHVLSLNRRQYHPDVVVKATRLLIESGFKVGYHMMVGLVGSEYEEDVASLANTIWSNDYSPDYLKIYPCVALKGNYGQGGLLQYLRQGWKPLDDKQYEQLLLEVKPNIPRYAKVSRIQRILPSDVILAGPSGIIDRRRFAGICNCISHRAIGWYKNDLDADFSDYRVVSMPQKDGIYLEAVQKDDTILGYARVTPSGKKLRAMVREIRVFGRMCCVGDRPPPTSGIQHIGIGRALMVSIENMAKEKSWRELYVNAGVGVREYFKKLGYTLKGSYMVKTVFPNNGGS